MASPSTKLPEKHAYRIGEVARLLDEPTHVVRFWEQSFTGIRPSKSPSGQRIYSRRDVERLLTVRHLVRERGFTLEGARRELEAQRHGEVSETPPAAAPEVEVAARVEGLREGLLRARAVLARAILTLDSREALVWPPEGDDAEPQR